MLFLHHRDEVNTQDFYYLQLFLILLLTKLFLLVSISIMSRVHYNQCCGYPNLQVYGDTALYNVGGGLPHIFYYTFKNLS